MRKTILDRQIRLRRNPYFLDSQKYGQEMLKKRQEREREREN